ncbi:MAG: T9SS type A sorting domain-containing protein [Bacteroidota bacterium]
MKRAFTFIVFLLTIQLAHSQCFTTELQPLPPACFGTNNGAIEILFNNAEFPVTYTLEGTVNLTGEFTQSANTIDNLPGGSYAILLVDAAACSTNISFDLEQPEEIAIQIAELIPATCGDANGSVTLAVTGGTGNYTYNWSNGTQTTATVTGLAAGVYDVTVVDGNGCAASLTFIVPDTEGLTADIRVQSNNCLRANSGVIDVSVTQGTAPYSYIWSNGATGRTASDLSAGSYSVTVTDDNGCFLVLSARITGSGAGDVVFETTTEDAGCDGACNGRIELSVSCGEPPFTFEWSDSRYNGQPTAEDLCPGIYTVSVTDVLGNLASSTLEILGGDPMEIQTESVTNSSCNRTCDGSIAVAVTGGAPPYAFEWVGSNGFSSSAEDVTGLCPAEYDLAIIDSEGCTTTMSWTIVEPEQLVLEIGIVSDACRNDGALAALPFGGQPPYTYRWNGVVGDSVITGLSAGYYLLEVIDAFGCVNERDIDLDGTIQLDVLTTFANCDSTSGGSATAVINSGLNNITFEWSNGGTGEMQNNLLPGGYSVTATDNSSGCQSHEVFYVERDTNCYVEISGYVYADFMGNCTLDSVDGRWGILVTLSDGQQEQLDFTDFDGYYQFRAEPGDYTISISYDDLIYNNVCADDINITTGTFGTVSENNNFFLEYEPRKDVGLKLSKPNPRPGFTRTIRICVMNYGDELATSTLTFVHDPRHQFVSSSHPALSYDQASRTVVWEIEDQRPYVTEVISVDLFLPATVPLGTQINYDFTLDPIMGDLRPQDNQVQCTRTVVGSYDPNDKAVEPAGRGDNGLLDLGHRELDYLIRFQNTGTDTAFTVVIRDTLDSDIDIETFQAGPASHPYDLKVAEGGILEFTFNNILLPDSNTNERASHGFVFYDIILPQDATPGTRIENTAAIYFDFNAPIITNTVVSTVRAPTAQTDQTIDGCDALVYNGINYTENATLVDTFELEIKDSISIVRINIEQSDFVSLSETYCESETPLPQGTYLDTLQNVAGCDSIIQLEVTVLPESATDITVPLQSGAFYQGVPYFNDTTFVQILDAANGCDSTVTVNIRIVTSTQNPQLSPVQIKASPNPTRGGFQIEVVGIEGKDNFLQLMDLSGRALLPAAISIQEGQSRQLDIGHLPNGIYHIRLQSSRGVYGHRLVKIE